MDSEEEVEKIVREMEEQNIVIPEHLAIVKKALLEKYHRKQALKVKNQFIDKIHRIEAKIFLWSAGSNVPVTAMIVGIEPTSFAEKTGILRFYYQDFYQFGERKLIGIARHEIGHVLFSRYRAVEQMIKQSDEKMCYFLERIYRYPEFHRLWNGREDVWINYIMQNPQQWGNEQLWEMIYYDYYYKLRIEFGVPPDDDNIKIDRDDPSLKFGNYEKQLQEYLETVEKIPQSVYGTELFLKAMVGHYSPGFKELENAPGIAGKLYNCVLAAQKDYDLSTKSPEVLPDLSKTVSGMSKKSSGLLSRKTNAETERKIVLSSMRSIQKFMESDKIVPFFIQLLELSPALQNISIKDEMLKNFNKAQKQLKKEQDRWIKEAKRQGKNIGEHMDEQNSKKKEKAQKAEKKAAKTMEKVLKSKGVVAKLEQIKQMAEQSQVEQSQQRAQQVGQHVDQLKKLVEQIQNDIDYQQASEEHEVKYSDDIKSLKPRDLKKAIHEALDEVLTGFESPGVSEHTPIMITGKGTAPQEINLHSELKRRFKQILGQELVDARMDQARSGTAGAGMAAAMKAEKELREILGLDQRGGMMGVRACDDPINLDEKEQKTSSQKDLAQQNSSGKKTSSASRDKDGGQQSANLGEKESGLNQNDSEQKGKNRITAENISKNGEEQINGSNDQDGMFQETIRQMTNQGQSASVHSPLQSCSANRKIKSDTGKWQQKLEYYEGISENRRKRANEVKNHISQISRKAKQYANKIRSILLGQSEREYEMPGKIGSRLNLKRYLKRESRFWDKVVVESDVESVDIDILIDLSGSMYIVNSQLARLAVFMVDQFNDLADVGINFRICGLNEYGIVKIFHDYHTGTNKRIDKEKLCMIFAEMEEAIGNGGWQRFALALEHSAQVFGTRTKSKHKLLFLISDGIDEDGHLPYENGRYKSPNPNVEKYIELLEKKLKVNVIGIGIGPNSDPINMFDPWIKVDENFDAIGEIIMKILAMTVSGAGIPRGNLKSVVH